MKVEFPIPAELTKKLDDTNATMHRIETLLTQLVLMQNIQLTVDQRNSFNRMLVMRERTA